VAGIDAVKVGLEEITNAYKRKVESSILPPDPLRIVVNGLRGPVWIEHVLPIPPILETVHSNVTEPLVEKLPRFPLTGDFPIVKWKEWIKE